MADVGTRQGNHVIAFNPGLIATDRFTRNVERVMRKIGLDQKEAFALLLSSHATTQVGMPEQIGFLITYLTSAKADFIPRRKPYSVKDPSSMLMAARLDHYKQTGR